jgi:hypothetical protein
MATEHLNTRTTIADLIAKWRKWDRIAEDLEAAGQDSDPASNIQHATWEEIRDTPATSADEVLLKLLFASEAHNPPPTDADEAGAEPWLWVVRACVEDAKRLAGGAS